MTAGLAGARAVYQAVHVGCARMQHGALRMRIAANPTHECMLLMSLNSACLAALTGGGA